MFGSLNAFCWLMVAKRGKEEGKRETTVYHNSVLPSSAESF
jgi:hypothetical protein